MPCRPATRAAWRWCLWSRRAPLRRGCGGSVSGPAGSSTRFPLMGTTGERAGLADTLPGLLARAGRSTTVPIAVGFGIATADQARAAADAGADGVIVGSRLVRAAGEADDPPAAVGSLVEELAGALADRPVIESEPTPFE